MPILVIRADEGPRTAQRNRHRRGLRHEHVLPDGGEQERLSSAELECWFTSLHRTEVFCRRLNLGEPVSRACHFYRAQESRSAARHTLASPCVHLAHALRLQRDEQPVSALSTAIRDWATIFFPGVRRPKTICMAFMRAAYTGPSCVCPFITCVYTGRMVSQMDT